MLVCLAVRVALFMLLFSVSPLFAQLEDDQFEVGIQFSHGRFVTNRAIAKIKLSDRYRKLLRSGLTDIQLINQLCDALDREFQIMPAPYFFTLNDRERELDRAGDLNIPGIADRRAWDKSINTFPGIGDIGLNRTNPGDFNEHLEKVFERSGLDQLINESDDLNRPIRFHVRDPLIVDNLKKESLGKMLDAEGVDRRLKPLDGLPANPEQIQELILDFYTPRSVTPKITLNLSASPPSLSIFETSRIAQILLPRELTDFSLAERLVYEALPHWAFSAFRKNGGAELSRPLDPEATKREIDLLSLTPDIPELPPVDTTQMAQIQQRLLPLEYTASLFDFMPDRMLFDLVLDRMTPQKGSGSEVHPVTATADLPANSPEVTSRPGAPNDIQPAPLAPAHADDPMKRGNTPREQQKNFIGGGVEYIPGQKIRTLGSYQFQNSQSLLGVEIGGAGSGFGKAHYSRDYVWFDTLGRRLTADFNGGSEYEQQRILNGVSTNERRTGGAVRLDLQMFRDWSGHELNLSAEGRHESVRLTAAQPETAPRSEVLSNLNTIDLGAGYIWNKSLVRHPAQLRIEPSIRIGVGWSGTEPVFHKFRIGARYHVSVSGPIEAETRFQGRVASVKTPDFELPSIGGGDSVRGFRTDESLGGRLWSSQNELWFPIIGSGSPSKFRDFIRRDVRLAFFYDAGAIHRLAPGSPSSLEGTLQGSGVGLRVRYQGVVIEMDWAYGFGNEVTDRPGRGRFYFNFRLP